MANQDVIDVGEFAASDASTRYAKRDKAVKQGTPKKRVAQTHDEPNERDVGENMAEEMAESPAKERAERKQSKYSSERKIGNFK